MSETFWGLGLKGAFCFTSLKLFHSHGIPKNYQDPKLVRKAEKKSVRLLKINIPL